ncbi:hypothetical protein [Ensifer sp. MJa1]|uniref:hypothetical protein n=1 Tax=Ensifer sp. MJa1 TaxID=2919888 RepID=UPI00300818E8
MAIFSGKVKVRVKDIIATGFAGSRWEIEKFIREGIISPPHKEGGAMQSRVFWWPEDIEADIERFRKRMSARQPAA